MVYIGDESFQSNTDSRTQNNRENNGKYKITERSRVGHSKTR